MLLFYITFIKKYVIEPANKSVSYYQIKIIFSLIFQQPKGAVKPPHLNNYPFCSEESSDVVLPPPIEPPTIFSILIIKSSLFPATLELRKEAL